MTFKTSTQMQNKETLRILGIDPGYDRVGVAIIDKINGKDLLVFSFCIETDKKLPHYKRLHSISLELDLIVEKYKPNEASTETLFFSANRKTALCVAEARGVILSFCAKHNIKITEYSPSAVKIAVTGHGKSDKKQIISILPKLLEINKKIKYDDEYDAIAIAITHSASRKQKLT